MVSRLGVDLTVLVMTEKEALKYYDVLGYPTMCYVDGNGKTYVLTGASYDRNDKIPANIISTFKIK